MATYQFSALSDGQAISFSPTADRLNFDQSVIAAADIRVSVSGTSTRIEVINGTFAGKDILLLNTTPLQLATSNVIFANGSLLLIGDNTTGTAADNSNNTLTGTAGRDHLAGLGGVDTMNGGAGDDAYYVTSGDVITDSAGIDTVYSEVSFSLGASSGVENLTMLGTASGTTLGGNQLNNVLIGSNASNGSINGRAGNDTMYGMGGNDIFDMSTGGTSTYGNDFIDGGSGTDTIDFGANARSALIVNLVAGTISGGGDGGSGTVAVVNVENVGGGSFNDWLIGNASTNSFFGGAGNDTLNGGAGTDRLEGGTGLDQYVFSVAPGAANADTVVAFATANDKIILDASTYTNLGAAGNFSAGDARFAAGAGFISGRDASDRVIYNTSTGQLYYDADGSGAGASLLIATLQGIPTLSATDIAVQSSSGGPTSGNDSLTGTSGNDTIDGLAGNDTINGLAGDDSLIGGTGNDSLVGGAGVDTMDGGAGNDTFDSDESDVLVDASGIDTVILTDPDAYYTLQSGFENLTLKGSAISWYEAFGNELDNRIVNEIADNGTAVVLVGGAGNDTLIGGEAWEWFRYSAGDGRDVIDGGTGRNRIAADGRIDFRGDLTISNIQEIWGGGGNDHFTLNDDGIRVSGGWGDDTVIGGAGNDTLIGDAVFDEPTEPIGHDYLVGGQGNDELWGERGYDTLDGGTGNDTLNGGRGGFPGDDADRDNFLFTVAPGPANADLMVGFRSGEDLIVLDSTAHANIGGGGNFAPNDARFYADAGANSAHDASDRVIYNTSTGQLWYDADGTGTASNSQLIATLQGAPSFTATDIFVTFPPSTGVHIIGSASDDTLDGTGGNDTIEGNGGNDRIDGLEGADSLSGGAGNDTIRAGIVGFSGDDSADTLDGGLGDDVYHVGFGDIIAADPGGVDSVVAYSGWTLGPGLENLHIQGSFDTSPGPGVGNELDNRLSRDTSGGNLFGMGGNDYLLVGSENFAQEFAGNGGEGNDTLETVGLGEFVLTGGAGGDSFVITNLEGGADITDFASGTDKIRLDASVMPALGASGNFAAGDERFHAGTAAAEADDRVIYDGTTGQLWYDADGNGSGAARLIATLQAGATVAATDIAVDHGTAPSGTINGTAGNDSLTGTAGNDTINGLDGNDTLRGLDGDDLLDGGAGTDSLDGGLGNDTYMAEAGDMLVADPGGVDGLVTGSTWNLFSMNIENVTLMGTASAGVQANNLDNFISGNDANNSIEGRGGNDTIYGGGGNDYFKMSTGGGTTFGFDVIDGSLGLDTVDYGGTALSALNVDLEAGTATGGDSGGGGGATLLSIEKFTAGNFNDRVAGNAAANTISGNAGNDTLLGAAGSDSLAGGDGDDRLEGGAGFDTVVGGAGADSFVFAETPGSANADRLTDFVAGTDQLLFENGVFTGLGAAGDWAAGDTRFYAAAGATSGVDANDRLVYNTTNGNLYYDADGAGGTGSQLVATLATLPALSAADITVI